MVISEEEEKEREQLYKDTGYQEDAEESKYPKDVSHGNPVTKHINFCCNI